MLKLKKKDVLNPIAYKIRFLLQIIVQFSFSCELSNPAPVNEFLIASGPLFNRSVAKRIKSAFSVTAFGSNSPSGSFHTVTNSEVSLKVRVAVDTLLSSRPKRV